MVQFEVGEWIKKKGAHRNSAQGTGSLSWCNSGHITLNTKSQSGFNYQAGRERNLYPNSVVQKMDEVTMELLQLTLVDLFGVIYSLNKSQPCQAAIWPDVGGTHEYTLWCQYTFKVEGTAGCRFKAWNKDKCPSVLLLWLQWPFMWFVLFKKCHAALVVCGLLFLELFFLRRCCGAVLSTVTSPREGQGFDPCPGNTM